MTKIEKIDLTKLSSDVVSNIASFMVGKPEYLWSKNDEALKRIQRKYMIKYLGPIRRRRRRKTTIHFAIVRNEIFFIKESIQSIITNQEDRILNIISDETDEDDENTVISLSINARECARKSDKQYEDNIFDCCDFLSPTFPTSEDDVLDDLFELAENIEDQIWIEHEQFNFDEFNISMFEFKLVFK